MHSTEFDTCKTILVFYSFDTPTVKDSIKGVRQKHISIFDSLWIISTVVIITLRRGAHDKAFVLGRFFDPERETVFILETNIYSAIRD